MINFLVQKVICRKTDCIIKTFFFKKFINRRIGERRIATEVTFK